MKVANEKRWLRKNGSKRLGEHITLYHLGQPIGAEVVKTPFFDAAGERQHG
jgi:sarcosine oxidase, subunit alpha